MQQKFDIEWCAPVKTGRKTSDAKARRFFYGAVESPYGSCFMIGAGARLAFLGFAPQSEHAALVDSYRRQFLGDTSTVDTGMSGIELYPDAAAVEALAVAVFDSKRDAPLKLILVGTAFQHRVWRVLLEIESGATTSYKQIADALGSGPRAVGGAVGRNPISYIVPCHRVLAADGTLNGYRWGLDVKAAILKDEAA